MTVGFAGQTVTATAGDDGRFELHLTPIAASAEPHNLTVRGQSNTIIYRNVLVGDVWFCGGQSNMKWNLGGTLESQPIIQSAELPKLRLLQVPKRIASSPQHQFDAQWVASSPETAGSFSAVGFLFGQRVHRESGVPIGLIMCAEGSTSVECWVSNETLESDLFAPAIGNL